MHFRQCKQRGIQPIADGEVVWVLGQVMFIEFYEFTFFTCKVEI